MNLQCIENPPVILTRQSLKRQDIKRDNQKVLENNVLEKNNGVQNTSATQKTIGLAVLGTLLIGLFRGKNGNAVKSIRQTVEKPARNGGKYVSETYKNQTKNSDGTISETIAQKIKTKYDKNGVITSSSIQDFEKQFCTTMIYDKNGLPCRKIVHKFKGENPFAYEYKVTHDFLRNGRNVKTTSRLSTYDNNCEKLVLKTDRIDSVDKVDIDFISKLSNPFMTNC